MFLYNMNVELLVLSFMGFWKVSLSVPPPVTWLGVDVDAGRAPSVVPVKFCLNCAEHDPSNSSIALTIPVRKVFNLLKHEPSSLYAMENSTLKMKIKNEAAYVMDRIRRFARWNNTSTNCTSHRRQKRTLNSILNWTSTFVIELIDRTIKLVFCDPDVKFPTTVEEVRNLTNEEVKALACTLSLYERAKINSAAFVEAVTYVFSTEGAKDTAKRYLENIAYYQLPDLLLNIPLVAWQGTFLLAIPLAIEAFNNNPGGDARDFLHAVKLFFLGA